MTNSWGDIGSTDLVVVMGGNAAEAHPCGFKWAVKAKENRGAKLIVVDPRYTRTASVADFYCPIRPGTDIAFLGGVIKYLLDNDKIQHEYVKNYTNVGYLVNPGYSFADGLFVGYDETKRDYDKTAWDYQLDDQGFAKVDDTLQDPNCVFQLMKKHFAIYTPELVEKICGSPKDKFLKVAEMIASCSTPTKTMTSMYALGWTQHSKGAQNIRCMAMIQLLLGNIGVRGGGMNALRGHSNIQGLTDLGLMSNLIPGYMAMPTEKEPDLNAYMSTRGFKPLRPNQMSYWQNYRKFFVSFQKAMWGASATAENDWAYEYLPKLDVTYDVLRAFDLMVQGKMNGYFCQGFNPLMTFPDRGKLTKGLSNLKYLVTMDPLDTETSRFWENHGEFNDVKSADIQTEVFQLPTSCFAEDEGSLVNSGRWLQWHYPGQEPIAEAKHDTWIMAQIWLRLKKLYEAEGGAFPDPIVKLNWPYADPNEPTPEELAKEMNGSALGDVFDPKDATKILKQKGKLLDGFAQLRDDGSTTSFCWIYSGCWTEAGNQMARRDNTDPENAGLAPKWAWAWPANRRILYNRASSDPSGKPWDDTRKLVYWTGEKWGGIDVPDYGPTIKPDIATGPFIMNPEGVARLFTRKMMRDGPFPTHYEPFESPVANAVAPKIRGNPAARIFKADFAALGSSEQYPYVGTSYRLTEHFHQWTKHNRVNAALQPEFFVEISEELAREKGIAKGGWVRVWSNRGSVKAKAVVTKRIKPLIVDGKPVHVVGIPQHWGFMGAARKGMNPNSLTPFVGDANIETPEYKAFLVNIEAIASGPVA
ncbi:MAG: formate dehydrogenase-N subunit alpha [Ancylobacter novellus]|uniref:Formate dehydrogenase-N subunit alpha n=1 Tax=Ancylobacter novellus TaxID=921 RepID=A0A2W5KPX5_ANCNO|nr:MAG: formate dehydrogenase-N subunit alpha [Ancylobacter novellus]